MNTLHIPAIADEAREWSLDRLTRHILEHYHKGTVDRVHELWTMAQDCAAKPGANGMGTIAQLLGESYADLSNHFRKEEMMLFPYIIELQETLNQGLQPEPFHCGSVQFPCRQMMLEHDGELERYAHILALCKAFEDPFASSPECQQLVNGIEVFYERLQEHIYLENENLFPRAIAAEGLPEME